MAAHSTAAEAVLEAARARFGQAEVYEESGESVSVLFEDNRLKEVLSRQFHGIGLRVVHNGRIGFASTSDLRDPARLVEMAQASAAYGDEARFEFPGRPRPASQPETYDPAVGAVEAGRMVEMGRQALDMSRRADDGYLFGCEVTRSTHVQRVLNTSGLDFALRSSEMVAHVEVHEVRDNGLLQVYEYKSWGRPFDSVTDLARTVLDKMRLAAVVVPARLEQMPVIFTPKALDDLFDPIGVALNGKHVHKGSSVLKGRVGEQVLDPRLTVTDDPSVPYAPASGAVDSEGTPTRVQHFFEQGVLRGYLTDLQTAALLGCEPSGHGFRGYESRPSPSPTNVMVAPGRTPFKEMVRGLKRGVVVEQTLGSGQSNVLAGEFSVNLDLGFLVEDGRIAGRVKDCMVAGNVYEVLKRVEAIGSEPQWLGSRCAPAIMVAGLKLAAQG